VWDRIQRLAASPRSRRSTRSSSRNGGGFGGFDGAAREAVLHKYTATGADASQSRDTITLYRGDLDRLKPGEFLNDSLVDFSLKYLHVEMCKEAVSWREGTVDPAEGAEQAWGQMQIADAGAKWAALQREMYIFSSFFYTKLREKLFDEIDRWGQRMAGFDLFEKRFLFVPINESLHWSLAIICNAGRMGLTEEERELLPAQDKPCIIFLDSLACHRNSKIYEMLVDYLARKWQARQVAAAKQNRSAGSGSGSGSGTSSSAAGTSSEGQLVTKSRSTLSALSSDSSDNDASSLCTRTTKKAAVAEGEPDSSEPGSEPELEDSSELAVTSSGISICTESSEAESDVVDQAQPVLSAYERIRLVNKARNEVMMRDLGLLQTAAKPAAADAPSKRRVPGRARASDRELAVAVTRQSTVEQQRAHDADTEVEDDGAVDGVADGRSSSVCSENARRRALAALV